MRRKTREKSKDLKLLSVVVIAMLALLALAVPRPGYAIDTTTPGLTMQGYINQSVSYALKTSRFDNKDDFNAFVTQALLETKYEASPQITMFLSLKFNADWAYGIYSGSNEWREKEFNKARDRLFILYKPRDVIGEAYLDFKPNQAWYFRVGKQIVQWGETDGFLLMNQINPVDERRGITDVEFENSLIPIWMIRAEYNFKAACLPTWLQELNIQGLFVPNADFARNESLQLGNDYQGVWNPAVELGPNTYLGKYRDALSKPDAWDPQGHAFGLRVTGTIMDARISVNGYYGRDHEVARRALGTIDVTPFRWDNGITIHPHYEAYYPIFKFVGATFTRDIDALKAAWLGNVAPVFRFEGLYAFDYVSSNQSGTNGQFWQSDEMRLMAGADWKVRVSPLNARTFFFISPQLYWRHIVDYPSAGHIGTYTGDIQYRDTWTTSLMISTSYWNNRLAPSFFWLRNWSNRSEFYKPQISYEFVKDWKATVGALFVNGSKVTQGLQPFSYKDHVYGTVSYKF
jgi:hypothetical protein